MSGYRRPELWRIAYPFSPPSLPVISNQATALRWAFDLMDAEIRINASVTSGPNTWGFNQAFTLRTIPQGAGVQSSAVEQSFFYSANASGNVSTPWPAGFPLPRADGAERILAGSTSTVARFLLETPQTDPLLVTSHSVFNLSVADSPPGLDFSWNIYLGEDAYLSTDPTVAPGYSLLTTYPIDMGSFTVPLYFFTDFTPSAITWSLSEASVIPTFF